MSSYKQMGVLQPHSISELNMTSMPDWNRAVRFWSCDYADTPDGEIKPHSLSSNKDTPIWKINVPGYLMAHSYGGYASNTSNAIGNQDTGFCISWNPANLIDDKIILDEQGNKIPSYIQLDGKCSDLSGGGSSAILPVIPGTSTYMCLTGGAHHIAYHMLFIPCYFIPTTISKEKFIQIALKEDNTEWSVVANWGHKTNTSDWLIQDSLLNPTDDGWTKIFAGNWRENIS